MYELSSLYIIYFFFMLKINLNTNLCNWLFSMLDLSETCDLREYWKGSESTSRLSSERLAMLSLPTTFVTSHLINGREEGVAMLAPHRTNRQAPPIRDGRPLRGDTRRWKVGRLWAGLPTFRRIIVRDDYDADNCLGFVWLGCMVILPHWY
jgi:hypothetical protein